jgi:hypothetical protein
VLQRVFPVKLPKKLQIGHHQELVSRSMPGHHVSPVHLFGMP